MTTRIGRCIKTPALTPYIEDAHQFNSQLGNLLRPALDTPEAIAAERRRTGEPADQHLARALASTSPAENASCPVGHPSGSPGPANSPLFTCTSTAAAGSSARRGRPTSQCAHRGHLWRGRGQRGLPPRARTPLPSRSRRLRGRRSMAVLNRPSRVRHNAPADRRRERRAIGTPVIDRRYLEVTRPLIFPGLSAG